MVPVIQQAFEAPGDGWCATIEVVGPRNAWAQVMKRTLNLAYPFDSPPNVEAIAMDLPGIALESWEAGKFATFSLPEAPAQTVAKLIDRLLEKFYSPGSYSVDCSVENLDE